MAQKKTNGSEPVTFELLTKFYAEFLKPQFEELKSIMNKNFTQINNKLDKLDMKIEEVDVKVEKIDDQFEGLKAELSDTVSKKEFNQFKSKVLS
jgi:peptidoglycan hydrolase CwlO-like protein